MFNLLLFGLFIYFVITYWPVAIVILIAIIALFIFACTHKESAYGEPDSNASAPKIGASVSKSFHDEAWAYCRRHHITMSDLIRNSVKKYMDENP